MIFISIGGWCGTKMALVQNGYKAESLPFDYVRSSILGVIDSFNTNFGNYFPKDKTQLPNGNYLSQCCVFCHEDITSEISIQSFNRKIERFRKIMSEKNKICFLRTITLNDYNKELKYYKKLQQSIDNNYPNIQYIICFVITKQLTTGYYKNLDNKTFIFTIDNIHAFTDKSYLKSKYGYILNFILNNNLFNSIPPDNITTNKVRNHVNTELTCLSLYHE